MNWFTTGGGHLINLDRVADIEPNMVYRAAGQLWLNPSSGGGSEEIAGAWLYLSGDGANGRFLLIDADDLARLRTLLTNGGTD